MKGIVISTGALVLISLLPLSSTAQDIIISPAAEVYSAPSGGDHGFVSTAFFSSLLLTPIGYPLLQDTDDDALNVANYKSLHLVVEDVKENNEANLTEDSIRTRAELRLRAAGLIPQNTFGLGRYLYVRVSVVGAAFSIRVQFNRGASWFRSDDTLATGTVTVWDRGITGTHGRSSSYILDAVSEVLDSFLNAYLKANQNNK